MGTLIGQKRTEPKTRIRAVSPKQSKRLRELHVLKEKLIALCGNRSEYSGQLGNLEPHHICGRVGKHLLNPFEIIMVTRSEHEYLQAHTKTMREELLALVKRIRIAQGFKEV